MCSAPSTFLALKVQLVVLVSAFVIVSTAWCVACLLFLYSRCPPCPAICKSGGMCPRALWSRRGNSLDKLRHPRSDAYSAGQVLLNKQQIWCGGTYLDCYRRRYCSSVKLLVSGSPSCDLKLGALPHCKQIQNWARRKRERVREREREREREAMTGIGLGERRNEMKERGIVGCSPT